MPAVTGELVLGGSGDRAGGRLDQVDDDRVRGVAGADRGHGVLSAMHMLVARYGQPGWGAALTPLSVAASTTLLADSRSGRNGGALPWALLVAGSVAAWPPMSRWPSRPWSAA